MTATGGCLCGGVRYLVDGPLRDVIACHCGQCRKTSGHFVAATACRRVDLVLESEQTLTWYRSSEHARRGFCNRCGGNVLWRADDSDQVSITAGTLDAPSGLRLARHIYVADKADYYDITDTLPQFPGDESDETT